MQYGLNSVEPAGSFGPKEDSAVYNRETYYLARLLRELMWG